MDFKRKVLEGRDLETLLNLRSLGLVLEDSADAKKSRKSIGYR